MEKNYYDILQINRNASPEIIEKAYKVLAKKYHPDLQPEDNKKQAETILKEINEAYEVLSNSEKKATYDAMLLEKEQDASKTFKEESTASSYDSIPYEAYGKEELFRHQQEQLQREQNLAYEEQLQRQQNLVYEQELQHQQNLAYEQELQQARAKAYHDAYIQDLKNRGYKIRYKKSLKDYIRGFISILVVVGVLFLLCQFPFVKSFLANLYEENELIRWMVDLVGKFFNG